MSIPVVGAVIGAGTSLLGSFEADAASKQQHAVSTEMARRQREVAKDSALVQFGQLGRRAQEEAAAATAEHGLPHGFVGRPSGVLFSGPLGGVFGKPPLEPQLRRVKRFVGRRPADLLALRDVRAVDARGVLAVQVEINRVRP